MIVWPLTTALPYFAMSGIDPTITSGPTIPPPPPPVSKLIAIVPAPPSAEPYPPTARRYVTPKVSETFICD